MRKIIYPKTKVRLNSQGNKMRTAKCREPTSRIQNEYAAEGDWKCPASALPPAKVLLGCQEDGDGAGRWDPRVCCDLIERWRLGVAAAAIEGCDTFRVCASVWYFVPSFVSFLFFKKKRPGPGHREPFGSPIHSKNQPNRDGNGFFGKFN